MAYLKFITRQLRHLDNIYEALSASPKFHAIGRLAVYKHASILIQRTSRAAIALRSPFLLSAIAFAAKDGNVDFEKILKRSDELFEDSKTDENYKLLREHMDSTNPDILWRLGRIAYTKAKELEKGAEFERLMREAFACVEKALEMDQSNFAIHKWYAITLSEVGELDGTKRQIETSYLVQEHFKKAIELNPKDTTSIHSLGYMCFMFADMSWYTRKLATVIFGSPPTSTYEEALMYFEDAERMEPNFYSQNLMMIGITCYKLGNKEKAIDYFKRTLDYPMKTVFDKIAHEKATEYLKKMGEL